MDQRIKSNKKPPSTIKKLYLILFNSVETVGWAFLLYKLLTYYLINTIRNEINTPPLFDQVKWLVLIFPNSGVLEIFHAAFGLVPSSPFVTALQVYSRVLIASMVILPTVAAKNSIGLGLALLAWSVTEIFRYSFYALNIVNAVPYFLLWMRYSIFLVMFPLGLCGELLLLYAAQQEFGKTGKWSLTLPNWLNFTINFQYFLILNFMVFAVGCGILYKHMLIQRTKVLEAANKKQE